MVEEGLAKTGVDGALEHRVHREEEASVSKAHATGVASLEPGDQIAKQVCDLLVRHLGSLPEGDSRRDTVMVA